MVKVNKNKYGNFITGSIVLNLEGYLKDDDTRTEISDTEAMNLLRQVQDDLAGSNDGSEAIANAEVVLTS